MPRGNKPIHGMRSGANYNGKRPRAYACWVNMRQRCKNPKLKDFKNYGSRGIAYCKEWSSFQTFLADMGEPPPGMTLERIDNSHGYSKENCRWATRAEQNTNKRNLVRYLYNGKNLTLTEWAKETGIQRLTLYHRIKDGASIEEALTRRLFAKRA